MHKFKNLVLGGTFDHLHSGHKRLIDIGSKESDNLLIGVANGKLLDKKNLKEIIQPFQERKKEVIDYLRQKNDFNKSELIEINDVYGNTLTRKNIDAILTTQSTYKNALLINKKREGKGLSPMKILKIDYLKGNDGKVISSERIRKGEIDRQGSNYFLLFKKKLRLLDRFRFKLREPLGRLFEGKEVDKERLARKIVQWVTNLEDKPTIIIAVGDIIVQSLEAVGLCPDISIIDFKSKRKKLFLSPNREAISVINTPGSINSEAVERIKKAFDFFLSSKNKQIIVIDGEEDLLALPAVLLAPLNSIVLYGQFNLGIIVIKVDEKMKLKIKNLLKNFQ